MSELSSVGTVSSGWAHTNPQAPHCLPPAARAAASTSSMGAWSPNVFSA